MLQMLADAGAKLNIAGTSEAKMSPVHWAASEGKIAALRFFLERRQDMNCQDGNGCSPVIVAAQHNMADSVAFLARNGADLTVRDGNGDTALHWAAYTGQLEVLGLLCYLMPHDLNSEDNYGQTPLHLAALKGHTQAVEYLLVDRGADAHRKDRNGLTALDVSMKKSQLSAEWVLRKALNPSTWQLVRGLSLQRLKSRRILSMILCGSNDKEMSNWPWRVVFLSNLFASVTSVTFALKPILLDRYPFPVVNFVVEGLWGFCFTMCLLKSPSLVRDENSAEARQRGVTYEGALDKIAASSDNDGHIPICHSCHVCKPLRSKHCKILRRCVNKFDHFW
jgi:ankyrin repeat protein